MKLKILYKDIIKWNNSSFTLPDLYITKIHKIIKEESNRNQEYQSDQQCKQMKFKEHKN